MTSERAARAERDLRSSRRAVGYMTVSLLALFLTSLWWLQTRQYEALGPYPQQEVLSRVEGREAPAVLLGDPVVVKAIKCTRTGDPVLASGQYAWSRIEPLSMTIPSGKGQGVGILAPGCPERVFENAMPEGIVPGRWRLIGQDEATRFGMHQSLEWTSEPFEVLPREVSP